MEVTLGGERLGSGKKEKIYLNNYERSTHDLGYVWKNTQAPGTLVPFMSEVALPGDVWELDLDADGKTLPTVGPLFGSFKMQLDVFQIPIRLYQGDLHMNRLGIGLKMQDIKLPKIDIYKANRRKQMIETLPNMINPSCILRYLGIAGTGGALTENIDGEIQKGGSFNAVPLLAYWETYKNYYANKQEEVGYVIHKKLVEATPLDKVELYNGTTTVGEIVNLDTTVPDNLIFYASNLSGQATTLTIDLGGNTPETVRPTDILFNWNRTGQGPGYNGVPVPGDEIFRSWVYDDINNQWIASDYIIVDINNQNLNGQTVHCDGYVLKQNLNNLTDIEPELTQFDLKNIDKMREDILKHTGQITPFTVWYDPDDDKEYPYSLLQQSIKIDGERVEDDLYYYSKEYAQEGLGVKTYQSDLFNNWISTEWLDGENGINEITKILTDNGENPDGFTINELILNKKIFDMLNRIAISGGSYDDWLDAAYTHERIKSAESPIYEGGLMKDIGFQEVVSNSESETQPLGTLGGRGIIGNRTKGGKVTIKVNEPSYILGIISLTPRIDYSQGNKWDVRLRTIDDLHKPGLDQIGFQELITDQMAFMDTGDLLPFFPPTYRSAGKQPAWINYMTNYNRNYGNFASGQSQDFMVLNRNYEFDLNKGDTGNIDELRISDLTTYIDPKKFNYIFAEARRDSMNFWIQVKVDAKVRRKMSAKVMPNL